MHNIVLRYKGSPFEWHGLVCKSFTQHLDMDELKAVTKSASGMKKHTWNEHLQPIQLTGICSNIIIWLHIIRVDNSCLSETAASSTKIFNTHKIYRLPCTQSCMVGQAIVYTNKLPYTFKLAVISTSSVLCFMYRWEVFLKLRFIQHQVLALVMHDWWEHQSQTCG